jgi:hypothetical protein
MRFVVIEDTTSVDNAKMWSLADDKLAVSDVSISLRLLD